MTKGFERSSNRLVERMRDEYKPNTNSIPSLLSFNCIQKSFNSSEKVKIESKMVSTVVKQETNTEVRYLLNRKSYSMIGLTDSSVKVSNFSLLWLGQNRVH